MPISLSVPLNSWMSAVDSNRSLAKMTIMGTHDSCAFHEILGIGRCQTISLSDQLNKGVRYLDIRCCVSKGSFEMHHGSINEKLNFDDVMNELRSFLNKNPSETFFMRIKQEYSSVSNAEFMSIFNGRYGNYHRFMLFIDTRNGAGSLSEARGKIVVISNVATMPGIQWNDIIKQDNDSEDSPKRKWAEVVSLLGAASSDHKTSDSQYYLNGFNAHDATDTSFSIKSMAFYIKDQFLNFLRSDVVAPNYYGILATDYIDLYSDDNMRYILYNNN
ncbi:phosphatidylinositol-specific phospholipase C domain-containing protein [Brucella sp. H1_1004]|uniref:phosphatidylinositol-specific phospholipase C domain-containing protein n=1 Tax=Brucella sp. H1_1004 TaxID=3110109 RepID=UPI0039B65655